MSVFSGPEINRDGLVLYYDLANGKKSWKGKPAINLSYGKFFNGNGNFTTNETIQDILPDGTIGDVRYLNADYVYDPNRTVSIGNYSLAAGETYTLSFYVKNISCTGFGGNLYSPGLGRVIDGLPYPTIYTNKWTRVIKTFTIPDEGVDPVSMSPQAFRDGGNGFFKMAWLQLEVGSYATKYVDGTRADTDAIVDISSQEQTIRSNNLTYVQDDTPTFNGTSDFLTVSNFSRFASDSNITIEAFVFPTSIQSYTQIAGRGYSSAGYPKFTLRRQSGQGWSFLIGDSTSNYVATDSDSVTTSVWQHVVGVLDRSSNTIKLYVNGALKSTTDTTGLGSFENAAGSFTIGRYINDTSYSYFAGEIDQIKVYNQALSEDQVKQNYGAVRTKYGL